MLLTEEQAQTRDAAHNFLRRERAPFAAEWDRAPTFPREAAREMGGLGFLDGTVPLEWDGAAAAFALAMEGIAAGCSPSPRSSQRLYRDVRVTRIFQGPNVIQRLVISRALGAEAEQGGRDR